MQSDLPTAAPLTQIPALISTPLPLASPTRDDLPAMVLTQPDIESEFPALRATVQDSPYRDNEAAAATSINPDDTALDLAALGRLDGYTLEFSDPAAFSTLATGGPISASVSVVLFATPETAEASLRRDFAEIDKLLSNNVEGITLKDFERLDAPDVGSNAIAGKLTITIAALGGDTISSFVAWQRGPILASVGATSVDDRDRSGAMNRLAQLMDDRIKGVLAGDIKVASQPTPPAPTATPGPAAVSISDEEAARLRGFDLAAMLPALDDLPPGAVLTVEGFSDQPGDIASYKREFGPSGPFVELGSSQVINIGFTVELYASILDARTRVTILETFGPDVFGQLVAAAVAGSPGLTPQSISADSLDLPPIGDLRAGFLVEIETAVGPVQGQMAFFSQGALFGQLVLIGPAIVLDDTVALVRLMEAGMRSNVSQ